MPDAEQVIVGCGSCGTKYDVATMAPGSKFKCQRCGSINVVPAIEEPVPAYGDESPPSFEQQENIPPPAPAPRPQIRPSAKSSVKPSAPAPPPSRISASRGPTTRVSSSLKRGEPPPTTSEEGEEEGEEIKPEKKKGGILAKENRKYFYVGGAVLIVLLGTIYVMHSRSVYERNKKISEQASAVIKEINDFVDSKDYVKALEKSEEFVKEFKGYDVPEVQKNVANAEKSIKGIEQMIEREKEGAAKLSELLDKKDNATPDQYEEIEKELSKFIGKYTDFDSLLQKANAAVKDLQAKIAAKQDEEDNNIYNGLMEEIKPMVDDGRIDDAIAHLKKYLDTAKISQRLRGALKKKQSELKAMK